MGLKSIISTVAKLQPPSPILESATALISNNFQTDFLLCLRFQALRAYSVYWQLCLARIQLKPHTR